LFRLDAIVGPKAATRSVVRAGAHDRLRAGATRSVELAVHEDVQPLAGDLGRNPQDRYDGAFDHVRRAHERNV
jgi:hypothetical protein